MIGYEPAASSKKEAPKKEAPKEVTFSVPDGFNTGGRKAGDTFEAVAQLCVEEDGTLCLLSLDGVPLSKSNEDAEAATPTEPSFTESVERGMTS